VFFRFDLLYLDGEPVSARPVIECKARLAALLADAGSPLHYCDHQILGSLQSSHTGMIIRSSSYNLAFRLSLADNKDSLLQAKQRLILLGGH